ncbi:MAG: LacI family transcriptional regulator, partial [Cytophagaceae bacterium]
MANPALRKSQVDATRAVTIRDVAGYVGVTPMTVSRVLNDTGRISESTRVAVRQAMRELGYEPNVNARRLAGARDERTVALLLPRLDFDVTLRKIATLQQLLSQHGYSVPLHAFGALAVPDASEQSALARELRRQKPRAIVCKFGILPPGAQDEVRRYQQEGGSVISFNEPADLECDQVLFDREDNNYQSARYLLNLGHRDIGLWMTSPGDILASPRLYGFQRALREYGVPERSEWLLHNGHYTCNESSGAKLAMRLLEMKERPTAMCIVNDSAAQACVAELQRGGRRLP